MSGCRSLKGLALFASFLLAVSITVPAVFGQATTGSISGTVLDPNGAVIAGSTVTITNLGTNISRSTSTDANGAFVFTNLAPGTYKVKIEKEGFGPQEIPSVQVLLGRDSALKPTLQVGQAGGEVTVVGTEAVLIEKNTVQVTNNFEARKVTDLPVGFFGGIDALALLAPGVVPGFGNVNGNGATLSVNGQRARSNNFTIDGQENNDNSIGGPGFFVDNEDIVQEFQIVTNNFSAEFGRNQGAIVNIITKSGTNSMHGTIVYYHQDSHAFDALSPKERASGLKDPEKFIDRRYGATLGGPMKKDKAFYFVSFQGENTAEAGNVFGTLSSKVITPAGIATLRAFNPTNQFLTMYSNFGPLTRNIGTLAVHDVTTQSFGTSSTGTLVPGVEVAAIDRTGVSSPFFQYEWSARADYAIDSRNQFSTRYLFQDGASTNATGRFLAGYLGDVPFRSQNLGMTWTRQLWSRSVNELRVNYGRLKVDFGGGSIASTSDPFGPKAVTGVTMPSGFLSFGIQSNLPQNRAVNTYQAVDNFSTQWREHTLKMGVDIRRQHTNVFFLPNFLGTFSMGSTTNIVRNTPSTLAFVAGDTVLNIRETDQFYYFQDDWRWKPNMTFNLGIRYENTGQPINRLRDIQLARESDPARAFFRQSIPVEQRILPKLSNDNNNWSPRVGFAWSPNLEGWWSPIHRLFGGDKSVVRGGYSIAYDPAFFNILLNMSTVAPQVLSFTQTGGVGSGIFVPANGRPEDVARQVNAPRNALDPNFLVQTRVAENFYSPYAENWSLGVQREVKRDMVFEVRYVGTRGIGLFQSVNGNPFVRGYFTPPTGTNSVSFAQFLPPGTKPNPVTGNIPGTADNEAADDGRILRGHGLLRVRQNSANSIYHGLQSRYQARLFKQLDLSVSYTWSHVIDNVSEIFGFFGNGSVAFPQTAFNINKAERGTSNFNRTQALATSFIWDVNFFKNVTGIAGTVLKGWQLNGTWQLANGQPWQPTQFAATTDFSELSARTDDLSFNSTFAGLLTTLRPFLSNPNAPIGSVGEFRSNGFFNSATGKAAKPDSVRWILNNTIAQQKFRNVFGVSRGLFTGDAINRWNGGIFKNQRLSERVTFQLRLELLNLFNHPTFGNPDVFADDVPFGTFANTSDNDAFTRRIRLSGKFIF